MVLKVDIRRRSVLVQAEIPAGPEPGKIVQFPSRASARDVGSDRQRQQDDVYQRSRGDAPKNGARPLGRADKVDPTQGPEDDKEGRLHVDLLQRFGEDLR